MMGINRSNLSRRTILFLLVLLGMPWAAHSATLEDSAKELARKIAAGLPARGDLSCEIRNTSSLGLDDVVRIEQALKTELDGRCVRTQANGSETAKIVVTLSENVKTLVWTAEIRQGAEYRELLQPVPRSTGLLSSTKALPIVLNSERFWDGPERVLDVELVTAPNGDQLTVMLLPDAVFIRNTSRGSENRVDIPLVVPTSTLREASGTLSVQDGDLINVRHDRHYCTVSLATLTLVQCWDYQGMMFVPGGPPVKGGQVESAPTNCTKGKGIAWFVTGTGDDTQPDSLKVVVTQNLGSAIASNQIGFPGPVLTIHDASGNMPRIIVKNLHTGNYEAYRLSISCTQ
jgi:hypothetical protein